MILVWPNSSEEASGKGATRRQFLVAAGIGSFAPCLHAQGQAQGFRLGPPVLATTEALLDLSTDTPPRALATDAEVHVVSGYEPSGDRATVRINRPGKRVVLVLTSYERMLWVVQATPATRLEAILVSVTSADSIGGVVSATPVRAFRLSLPYAHEADNVQFRMLLDRLHELFGIARVDAFRGEYRIPRTVRLDTLDAARQELTAAGVQPTRPRTNFAFELVTVDFAEKVRWSLTGPATAQKAVYEDRGGFALALSGDTVYRIGKNGLDVLDRATGTSVLAKLPPNFPSFSWPTDVAYDTRLNVVSVVTLGGEGFMYRYDVVAQRWLDFRSLNNVDISSLAYDDKARRYVAWTTDGSLLLIPPSGSTMTSYPLAMSLPAFGATYDRGNGQAPRLTVIPRGNLVAVIQIAGGQVERIWVYDIKARVGRLTYVAGSRP